MVIKNENIEILRVLAVHTRRGTYSRSTASASSTSASNLLQLPFVEPSVNDLCRTMGLIINCRHGAQTVEVYVILQVSLGAYLEYFGTASTRSANTTNTNGRNT